MPPLSFFSGAFFDPFKERFVAITAVDRIRDTLKPGQRLLGLDIGSKTIGLALSDVTLTVASPAETINRGKFAADAGRLAGIIAEENVGGLVLGLPVQMDGAEGRRCQSVRQFADNLLEHIDLPIAFWDERLSTAAVERVLIDEADMTRKRRAEVIDKMAAAYILQGALDAMP
ncbi:MAG: Holliday junction resolvase RuvX [Rhodospirillaceae bacterium]|jgi:putative Holliday junction resolvase|nr:Holliday junction resolvase RuvX [Rhodospirillaceae bacterium]|tara:strand:+ start:1935 stop:2453 length:519 start_codon:yes stop_codon:yes gene_type:complete